MSAITSFLASSSNTACPVQPVCVSPALDSKCQSNVFDRLADRVFASTAKSFVNEEMTKIKSGQ